MNEGLLLQCAVILPVVAAVLIALAGERRRNLREGITLITAAMLFGVICGLYPKVHDHTHLVKDVFEPINGLSIALTVEPLGILFALVCSSLWIITSVYSIGYMRANEEHEQTRFYVCFALAIAASIGVALSANMFSLFVFYELLTLSTYPLVTHSGTEEAKRAGRLYLGYLLGTSIGLQLLAIIWTWSVTGTLDFTPGGIFDQESPDELITVLYVLYVFGIGKAALMPLHRWLPAAMVAPTPVSALLHAVAVVKAGVFTILKVTVYIFGVDTLLDTGAHVWLIYVAGATIIIASVIALQQDNLKARLAYSTISQLAYVIMATALLAPLSILAAAMHIVVHAFGKITLFFASGAITTATGKTRVSELSGIGKSMPWTMAAFAIGSLSMIGVPPAAGYLSKWYLLQAGFSVENMFVLVVIVFSTFLNASYFLPIVYNAFFGRSATGNPSEAPLLMLIPLVFTAAATLGLIIAPTLLPALIRLTGAISP